MLRFYLTFLVVCTCTIELCYSQQCSKFAPNNWVFVWNDSSSKFQKDGLFKEASPNCTLEVWRDGSGSKNASEFYLVANDSSNYATIEKATKDGLYFLKDIVIGNSDIPVNKSIYLCKKNDSEFISNHSMIIEEGQDVWLKLSENVMHFDLVTGSNGSIGKIELDQRFRSCLKFSKSFTYHDGNTMVKTMVGVSSRIFPPIREGHSNVTLKCSVTYSCVKTLKISTNVTIVEAPKVSSSIIAAKVRFLKLYFDISKANFYLFQSSTTPIILGMTTGVLIIILAIVGFLFCKQKRNHPIMTNSIELQSIDDHHETLVMDIAFPADMVKDYNCLDLRREVSFELSIFILNL